MSGSQTDLRWTCEMACRAAWPAAIEVRHGDWTARYDGSPIRRTNSLNPLPGATDLTPVVRHAAEAFYAGRGRRTVIRLLDFAASDQTALKDEGYRCDGNTQTLHARLDGNIAEIGPDTTLHDHASAGWHGLREALNPDGGVFRSMLQRIEAPLRFAETQVDGQVASIAYGVLIDDLLVIEAVATDPVFRGRGLARQTVGALINWARRQGAGQATLQVVAENAPARALYQRLGFDRLLFSYSYMYAPEPERVEM